MTDIAAMTKRLRTLTEWWGEPFFTQTADALEAFQADLEKLAAIERRQVERAEKAIARAEKAEVEIERLQERVHYAEGTAEANIDRANEAEARAEKAEAEIKRIDDRWQLASECVYETARNVALEEAAQVAESYEPRCDVCPRGVAAAIRALGDKHD